MTFHDFHDPGDTLSELHNENFQFSIISSNFPLYRNKIDLNSLVTSSRSCIKSHTIPARISYPKRKFDCELAWWKISYTTKQPAVSIPFNTHHDHRWFVKHRLVKLPHNDKDNEIHFFSSLSRREETFLCNNIRSRALFVIETASLPGSNRRLE